MTVSRDDVLRTARLARLHVSEDRLDAVAAELSGILSHMDQLQQVDVPHHAPSADTPTLLREDIAFPQTMEGTIETWAVQVRDGFFLVPRLQTHEDGEATA